MADHDTQTHNFSHADPERMGVQETVSQEPDRRSLAEEPDDQTDTETQPGRSHQETSPEGLVEPQAGSKISDHDDTFIRPYGFDERFVVTQRRNAQDLYRSYTDKRPAIEDRGHCLKTKNADRATAMDMVEIATHRSWLKINVKGPEAFRREMWIEATAQGIDVRGYRPSSKDRSEADRRTELVGYRVIERADRNMRMQCGTSRTSTSGLQSSYRNDMVGLPDYEKGVRGKITEVGEAPYNNREGAARTPYVALKIADGRSHRLWGVGLPSMIEEKNLSIGDTATISSVEKKNVTVEKRDETTGKTNLVTTYRREWIAKDIDRSQGKIMSDPARNKVISQRDDPQTASILEKRIGSSIEALENLTTQDMAVQLKAKEAERKAVSNGLKQLTKELISKKTAPIEKFVRNKSVTIERRNLPQRGCVPKKGTDGFNEDLERHATQDRAIELEERMKSSIAGHDPFLWGAASKLSLIKAELKAQGVDDEDVKIAMANARTQISKELAAGKTIPVEKLANVTPKQEEKARANAAVERTRITEREKNSLPNRNR